MADDETQNEKSEEPKEAPKLVRVRTGDGKPVEDSGNGEGFMTAEEWKNRNQLLGLVRVDAADRPLPDQDVE